MKLKEGSKEIIINVSLINLLKMGDDEITANNITLTELLRDSKTNYIYNDI